VGEGGAALQSNKQIFKTMASPYLKGSGVMQEQERLAQRLRNQKPKYHTYIKSKTWEYRKNKYFGKTRRCSICKSTGSHVHHKTYTRLGKETKQDLVLLCGACHKAFHDTHAISSSMVVETDAFIDNNRALHQRQTVETQYLDSLFFSNIN
jgi:5-methylcytosine-specific restriction endonuclease McrA